MVDHLCLQKLLDKQNIYELMCRYCRGVIRCKANEKNKPTYFAKILYKARACIEQGFGMLKRFNRVAPRWGKTARNFRSIVSFAAGLTLIKFVHSA